MTLRRILKLLMVFGSVMSASVWLACSTPGHKRCNVDSAVAASRTNAELAAHMKNAYRCDFMHVDITTEYLFVKWFPKGIYWDQLYPVMKDRANRQELSVLHFELDMTPEAHKMACYRIDSDLERELVAVLLCKDTDGDGVREVYEWRPLGSLPSDVLAGDQLNPEYSGPLAETIARWGVSEYTLEVVRENDGAGGILSSYWPPPRIDGKRIIGTNDRISTWWGLKNHEQCSMVTFLESWLSGSGESSRFVAKLARWVEDGFRLPLDEPSVNIDDPSHSWVLYTPPIGPDTPEPARTLIPRLYSRGHTLSIENATGYLTWSLSQKSHFVHGFIANHRSNGFRYTVGSEPPEGTFELSLPKEASRTVIWRWSAP